VAKKYENTLLREGPGLSLDPGRTLLNQADGEVEVIDTCLQATNTSGGSAQRVKFHRLDIRDAASPCR